MYTFEKPNHIFRVVPSGIKSSAAALRTRYIVMDMGMDMCVCVYTVLRVGQQRR